jgi:hypothetical protein
VVKIKFLLILHTNGSTLVGKYVKKSIKNFDLHIYNVHLQDITTNMLML